MSPDYNIGDVVYYINDYKVIKCTIEAIVIKSDRVDMNKKIFSLKTWKNDEIKQKTFNCVAAQIVNNLGVAKASALINWERITKQVKKSLENLTDKDFGDAQSCS